MDRMTGTLRCFGLSLVVAAGSLGCAADPGSPTAPSVLSTNSGAFALMDRPGAEYNASGSWHVVVTGSDRDTINDEFDVVLTQDANGNLTFSDDTAVFTFTRIGPGTGRMIPYAFSAFGPIVLPNSPCETNLKGSATLDTQTNTITLHRFSGNEDDCVQVSGSATLTRNP